MKTIYQLPVLRVITINCIIWIYFAYTISAQYNDISDRAIGNSPYCFRFTWLGPKYGPDNNIENTTCEDIIKAGKVPCNRPLIVTDNSNIPNTTSMWETYKSNVSTVSAIACRLLQGDVCVKYSYIYNGAVENITYMCTKVNIENGDAVTSNCYSEYRNGREISVCVCKSIAGEMPCNSAPNKSFHINYAWFILSIIHILLFKYN